MNTVLENLLRSALVGTDRQDLVLPSVSGPVGDLLAQLGHSADDAPARLLRLSGVVALCARTGFVPAPAIAPAVPRAPPDSRLPHEHNLTASVLKPLLDEGPERLQVEFFNLLEAAGLRLAPELLAAALEAGGRSTAIRPALVRVLGARGIWLANLNPAWAYAASGTASDSAQDQWAHGNAQQRQSAFQVMRQADPAGARERLAAELGQLTARERADFCALLAQGLSSQDESLLETLLKDRSREVRQNAATLLARLPLSRHCQVITAELALFVRVETGLLGKRLAIDAPTVTNPAWKAEGIEAARPQHESLGERAWWLYQLVRNAPLHWWSEHCGMDIATLLKATSKSEWKEALRRGWRDAAVATGDVGWAQALLADWDQNSLGPGTAEVIAVLPLAQREQHWERALDEPGYPATNLLPTLLPACAPGCFLSHAISKRLSVALAHEWAPSTNHGLRYSIADALCILHVDALEPVLTALSQGEGGDAAARGQRIITARRALAHLVPSNSMKSTTP